MSDEVGGHRLSAYAWRRAHATGCHRSVEYLLLSGGVCAAAFATTWPYARVFTSHVVDHIDPLFSMWRLAWFSHALRRGEHLLHANIFYPEPSTFLFSDATLLQGAMALPAHSVGIGLPAVYNALLFFGLISSGVAIYWLATGLQITRSAAVLAAIVFSIAPYRIEHLMHLELQWVAPSVVALGSFYYMLFAPRWKYGVILAACVSLQFLACVYYAVFLLPILVVLALSAATVLPDRGMTVRVAVLAAAMTAMVTLPIASLYRAQETRVGERPIEDIAAYSATPRNYLASPSENVLYGGTADHLGSGERRMFPGVVALAFATVGLFSARRRIAIAALLVVLLSLDLSFGLNGLIYPRLLDWWPVLRGLRAPARYGVFVLAGVAILAALGYEALVQRVRWRYFGFVIAPLAIAAALVEYRSPQHRLLEVDQDPAVYRFLNQRPQGVVLEFPVPTRIGAENFDAQYVFWSTKHWNKLVNGYSGYYPPSYEITLQRLQSFPDDDSLALLRERDVRYVVVHLEYLELSRQTDLLAALLAQNELQTLGSYSDWMGRAAVFELTK